MQLYSAYLALFAALSWTVAAQGIDSFVAKRQEYCNRGNLCLTSFDWCQMGTMYSQNGNISTGYCDRRETGPYGTQHVLYAPSSGTASGIVAFRTELYNLTWSGADLAYPVQVEFTFGPPEGPINRTMPLWRRNITASFMEFRLIDMFLQVDDQDPSDVRHTGYGMGWPVRFSISQPGRPAVEALNFTDQTNDFMVTSLAYNTLVRQFEDHSSQELGQVQRRWKLGVGIGVGIGVPVLLAIAFALGAAWKTRSSKATAKNGASSGKRASDFS